ncbi:aldehyde dehydrogenase family protein [Actinoplanes sp. TBRC 11911]|uniref:aldehyde dehydrogenase family protein n=1 Tax=Actinoplanes sp. TBRC 11911 TaxID=2729386 RepID=UPI00145D14B3|nr:aldehyde dehydrogenase family protein [Actinoplanes sp. TBRC 11911]NMO56423.1 aldehyde dehydrogenase family protein [Actinoplanes sp. TBRC 11911]
MQLTPRIGGRPASADLWTDVLSPYDGSAVARVPALSATHVAEAVAAAAATLARADFPRQRRAEVLEAAAVLLTERTEEFAVTIARESGTPIRYARAETTRAAKATRAAAVECRRMFSDAIDDTAGVGFVLHRPIGVVAALTPSHGPLEFVARQVAPAIAAGCPLVLKPAEATPVSAIRFVDLLVEAGLPADWISVVTGRGADAGHALVAHPVPALIAFAGGAEVGREIRERAPDARVLIDPDMKAALILEPDAELDRVIEALKKGAFRATGRVLVHRSVYDRSVERLCEAICELQVGDPLDAATMVGPLISPADADAVEEEIAAARRNGAEVTGGKRRGPSLLAPAVIEGPPGDVRGPVVTATPYADLDEAVALAGSGTAAGIFTSGLATAVRAARELRFDTVLINDVPCAPPDRRPTGVREMTAEKNVMVMP